MSAKSSDKSQTALDDKELYFNPGKCPGCGQSSTWACTSRVILPSGALGDYRIYICVRCKHMSAY
jgi:hypothetical protein